MVLNINENKVKIFNCSRPKMTTSAIGRTWDKYATFVIDGKDIPIYADTTWGKNGYFSINDKWYKIKILEILDYIDKNISCVLERGSI